MTEALRRVASAHATVRPGRVLPKCKVMQNGCVLVGIECPGVAEDRAGAERGVAGGGYVLRESAARSATDYAGAVRGDGRRGVRGVVVRVPRGTADAAAGAAVRERAVERGGASVSESANRADGDERRGRRRRLGRGPRAGARVEPRARARLGWWVRWVRKRVVVFHRGWWLRVRRGFERDGGVRRGAGFGERRRGAARGAGGASDAEHAATAASGCGACGARGPRLRTRARSGR